MTQEMGDRGFVRSAGLISACTLVSRILGMARDILSSHFFGATMAWDAFALAFRIPNLFRRLFGEGALTAAFLPAFVERWEGGKQNEARALLNKLLGALAISLGAVALIGIGCTFVLPGDEKSVLFARLLRIMAPYLALVCMAAILGAALNGLRHYFTPAIAPVLLNMTWIAALLLFMGKIEAVAWAVLVGGVLEMLVMLPSLFKRGIRARVQVDFRDPGLREVGGRFLPMVFGLALVQINEVVASVIAEVAVPGHGAVSAIYYGNQITQLPLSLIGMATATAVFPLLSSPKEDFKAVFGKAMRLVLFMALPATVGLMVLARPIVGLIFEHGKFGAEAADRTTGVILYYAIGLWGYCANTIQVRAFYARKDVATPVRVSAGMVFLNLTLTLVLVGPMREQGVALANSVTGLATFLMLNRLLRRRMGGDIDLKPVYWGFVQSVVASVLMGAAVWGVYRFMAARLGTTFVEKLALVMVPIACAVGFYFLLARLFRMEEVRWFFRRRHENR